HHSDRIHVTLTFAQSIDAKIAAKYSRQLILSGIDSLRMTHWIRTRHDAILVGIGTALNDDPQLNVRHLPPADPPHHLPRPIILDSHLRFSLSSKLLANYNAGTGRRPWILSIHSDDPQWLARKDALEHAGVKVISVHTSDSLLPLPPLLQTLHSLGIRSLMVEGGARIIASFFSSPDLLDNIIITVAPTIVGDDGLGYALPISLPTNFTHTHSQIFGPDTVVAWSKI
ncbi:dihydrofolate reductase-like domain-containing protein, partial [Cyathus striatus]